MLIALPLGFVALALLRQTPVPNAAARTRDVERLATVVAIVDEMGLRAYLDLNGCRLIEYREGSFTDDLDGGICGTVDPAGVAMTERASTDFERVRLALSGTGVAVFSVYVVDAYDDGGGGQDERQVVFDLDERARGRWAYVYEPGHEPIREGPFDDATSRSADIDEDWFFMAWDPGQQ